MSETVLSIFKRAALIAREAGTETITAQHLGKALSSSTHPSLVMLAERFPCSDFDTQADDSPACRKKQYGYSVSSRVNKLLCVSQRLASSLSLSAEDPICIRISQFDMEDDFYVTQNQIRASADYFTILNWVEENIVPFKSSFPINSFENELSKLINMSATNEEINSKYLITELLNKWKRNKIEGGIWTIGGWAASGKHGLVNSIVLYLSDVEYPVLYYSLRSSKTLLSKRFVSISTGIPLHEMKEDRLSEAPVEAILSQKSSNIRVDFVNEYFYSFNLFFNDLQSKIEVSGIKVIVIDNLSDVVSHLFNANLHEKGTRLLLCKLRELCKENNILLLLLTPTNYHPISTDQQQCGPILSDIKYYHPVVSFADVVLLTSRPEAYSFLEFTSGESCLNKMEITLAKNIHWAIGSQVLPYNSTTGRVMLE
jgi:DnaB-like helicase C terminal domain